MCMALGYKLRLQAFSFYQGRASNASLEKALWDKQT